MGVIYQAEDPAIGRTVAIKLVRADLLEGRDREVFLERFRREARAAGRCSHPNIVALYDFAIHEGNPFLAMEYIDGVGLGQALKRVGRFAPTEAVAIAVQVLDALAAAHALGIVHRDVKPANILVPPNGQVKVTDFGISRIDTSDITQDGTAVGTPSYMSPEQCRGESVDARADLFSVGTVLYELLSGTRAFNGRNATEVTYQLLTQQPRDLTEFVADIPDSLAAILRKALAKDREARFASAQEMASALRQAFDGLGGEQTEFSPVPAVFEPPAHETFDDAILDTVERRLASHIGPIARHLVREAARRSQSLEQLCESVAESIDKTAERRRFLADMLDGSARRTAVTSVRSAARNPPQTMAGAAPAVGFSDEQIARVERALTQHLGPIARLLVKRALPGSGSETALWDSLAAHIETPADRAVFLRQRPGG